MRSFIGIRQIATWIYGIMNKGLIVPAEIYTEKKVVWIAASIDTKAGDWYG